MGEAFFLQAARHGTGRLKNLYCSSAIWNLEQPSAIVHALVRTA
jgi:hypothetical protein